jgi:hypothetical protein
MIRTQIIMFRMRDIFVSLILIFERNKIFFIIEFIYYKFSVIICEFTPSLCTWRSMTTSVC